MKNSKKLALAALVAGSVLAAPCFAQGYVDVGIGQSKLRDTSDFSSVGTIDNKKTAYALRLGYRLHPNFAVDAGYYDFGKYKFSALGVSGDIKASSWGASVVAIAPFDQFDVYGRIGYARSEAKASGGGATDKSSENEAFYGVGGHWNFAPQWGLLVEYQRQDKLKIDTWFGGLTMRF